ncbi:hypothetical protein [Dactylosporangium matsuzakiense]|uniref:Uncharacterized protein n=1 Tax=Dactylosporangium matsuzakiense TaxID=53360 RepID=A0A9W6KGT8_9ACTN|nr:hypothetical protein [Dactylosporangium matsuzakiense]UWZ45536.1 hypothetical protein Dmats_03130 [Dactylosporangium matsuzakiense]GLL00465.1 hypothetical protein GCM10017581_022050 [Dactylosporangium matsuzakiense]
MKRRWVVTGVLAWIAVIAGAGLWSYFNDPATTRDQTTIADALPTVDTALARIHSALDPSASVSVLGGYRRTEVSCRVTSARDGTRFTRELLVYVKPSTEAATLDRVKAALPASYEPSVTHSGATDVLSADAGGFVLLRGTVTDQGTIRFTADTGCRVQDAPAQEPTPTPPDRAPVQAVLTTLGTTASQWRTHQLTSPSCRSLSTVEADITGDAARVRSTVDAGSVVLDTEKLFAYRTSAAAVTLRTEGDTLTVTSTTGC